ncbi:Rb-like protein [Heterostelium album PN500]|uniref:Rb-like protein n=1 Tax=Heterostelium pallidum (strain ATCC 26659 / Pp 5 / PN500) TaxID=670386 RepID=D3B5Q8_HETP5|nr:Rb-like protein [Heterostelium album PN500]EFA83206.1 Rb-like protein [Heterostelium album PN500]|eukprot:XP_020435323.1 Rb-like protein [Heterostelium album PN500]
MDISQDQVVKRGRPLPDLSRSNSCSSMEDDTIIQSQGGSMDELVAAVDSLRGEQTLMPPEDIKQRLNSIACTLNIDESTLSTALELLESIQLSSDRGVARHRLAIQETLTEFCHTEHYLSQWSPATSSIKTINSGSSKQHSTEEYLFSVGWLLYLHCKSKLFNDTPDLLQSIHIILCCLNLLYLKSPSTNRKLTFNNNSSNNNNNSNNNNENNTDNKDNDDKSESSSDNKKILEFLSKSINGNLKELVNTNQKIFSTIITDMVNNHTLKTSDGDDYFSNISLLTTNFLHLNKLYEHQYYSSGDIDERVFLFDKEIVGTPFKSSSSIRKSNLISENQHQQHHQGRIRQPLFGTGANDSISSSSSSSSSSNQSLNNNNNSSLSGYPTTPSKHLNNEQHSRQYPPQTPVSATVTMVSWIKQTVGNNDIIDSVSQLIKECCGPNAQDSLDMIAKLVSELTDGIDNLYLSDELITSDEQAILTKQFHRSLLATSFEMVAYSHKLDSLLFPHFVKLFGLHPFSYYRIIDSIVKIDDSMPHLLVTHLLSIEERIVEQYAWTEGSTVFALIESSKEHLRTLSPYAASSTSTSTPLKPPSTPSHASNTPAFTNFIQNFSTPTKPTAKPTPLIATPTSYGSKMQSPGPKSRTSIVLINFFRKVLNLIRGKCKNFCMALSLPNDVLHQILWASINLIIEHTELLKNRSLDIIAISTIYAICKLNSIAKTYKTIIESTSIPTKVYKDIPLTNGTGDIVAFYNELYLPTMDATIHQAAEKCQYLKNISTPTKLVPSSPRPSPLPLQQKNITFSPMVSRTSNNINLTPSKLSYSIGRTPSKELKVINMNINNSSSSNIGGVSTTTLGMFGTPSKSTHISNSSSTPSSSVSSTSSSSNVSPVLSSSSSSSDFNENISNSEANTIDNNNNSYNNNNNSSSNKSKGKRLFFGDDSNTQSPTQEESCPEPPLKK